MSAAVVELAAYRRRLDAAHASEAVAALLAALSPLWAAKGTTVEDGVSQIVADLRVDTKDKPSVRLVRPKGARR